MDTIDLAYVGHGIHEELVARIADQEGYYEDEGVHVAVREGVAWETERTAPRRDDRPGPGPRVAADRRDWLEGAQRQHPSPAVLVPRRRRRGIHGGSSRAAPGGPRRPHGPGLLRPDRPAQAWPGPRPRPGVCVRSSRRRLTRWICDGFGTAPSTPPTWAARWPSPRQVAEEEGFHLLAGLASTSRSPPSASPSTRPRPAGQPRAASAGAGQPAAEPSRRSPSEPGLAVDYDLVAPHPADPR